LKRAVPLGAVLAAALLLPAGAHAHGLVQRPNLAIPEWLFGWAAAVVLVVSFAALGLLWSRPRLEEDEWRPLPGGAGKVLASKPVEIVTGALGVALLAVVIVAGFAGSPDPLSNFAPVFLLIVVWVGMAFASVLFGDVFRAFNPWRAIGRVLIRNKPHPYPERFGVWPAAAALLIFAWVELASGWSEHPARLAAATLAYTFLTLAGMAYYGTETWASRGEAFSVYFNLLSRLSIFETRDREVGIRPLLRGLPPLDQIPGIVGFVVVMIGTVTFDGLSQGALWKSLSGGDEGVLADTIGLLLGVALVATFYRLGMTGARTVGGGFETEALARAFVHSLVPIAAVYVAAHYLTFLIFEGQAIRYTAADPFNQGWDLFGWASTGINYGVLSQNAAWYLQVSLVVIGHVAALVLAHDRALSLYGQARLAVRSQYWMLGIMIGFTTLALWLLAQAGTS
jgi:hypothetical protein